MPHKMLPSPWKMVGTIPVWRSGHWTFSPFTVADAFDYSHHAMLQSACIEVDFLNLMNAAKGKTTYTHRSRESLVKRFPIFAKLILPALDDAVSGVVPKISAWRSLHTSIRAHNPHSVPEFEEAIDYLAKCDEFTELLSNTYESIGNETCEKLIEDFLGFREPSELGYPSTTKLIDLLLIETALCALAKYDLSLSKLSASDNQNVPFSYISSLLNPNNSPIKQWWIDLKNQLNLKSFRELADLLQDKHEVLNISNNTSEKSSPKFDYTQIRKWASGRQRMKWDTAFLLEKLIVAEADIFASPELNAVARILSFLEGYLAMSAGLDLKQHGQIIRTVLLNRYKSKWQSELSSVN